jgi:hypothetical protein
MMVVNINDSVIVVIMFMVNNVNGDNVNGDNYNSDANHDNSGDDGDFEGEW